MTDHTIYITCADADKLRELIREAQYKPEYRNSAYLKMLSAELDRANLVESHEIPADVITMNTEAVLRDVEDGEEMVYKLVFPENADPMEGRISILAPIGTAMLGFRVGDAFEWDTPGGVRKIRVEKIVYQPEASGNFEE